MYTPGNGSPPELKDIIVSKKKLLSFIRIILQPEVSNHVIVSKQRDYFIDSDIISLILMQLSLLCLAGFLSGSQLYVTVLHNLTIISLIRDYYKVLHQADKVFSLTNSCQVELDSKQSVT